MSLCLQLADFLLFPNEPPRSPSSALLLFLSTGVEAHQDTLVGRVLAVRVPSLLTDVLDVVKVFEHLVRRQDLSVQSVIVNKLERADSL